MSRVPTVREAHTRFSVIVPARNEAATLPALLTSLARQTCRPQQIIVVDDDSTDETAAVAQACGVTVIRAGERPQGWAGKPWACQCGAGEATGELLLFLDADVTASPEFLQALEPLVTNTRGLVSVAPFHHTKRLYEQASALFNLVAMMGTGMTSIHRSTPVTGAFGPCIAMRAVDYHAIGGHGAVRGSVLEDVELSRRVQADGRPVMNLAGGNLLGYRMYGEGPGQLVEGWSKNFAAGAGRTPFLRLIAIVAWISGLIEAGWRGAATLTGAAFGTTAVSWPYALFYLLFAWQLHVLLRRIGRFTLAAWLHPLSSAAFIGICVRSIGLLWRGEVKWKGRRIRT